MTKEAIQNQTQHALRVANRLLSRRPDDDLVRATKALVRILDMIDRQWPLAEEDLKEINIGMYAIRVLEGGPYRELPDLLMALDSDLKRGLVTRSIT